uniref:C2H2-type domain-containing protein n=1 Tax=Macrostomum lignano TaxID=282301 RepID=A0A1I8IWB2_9PLAT
RCPAVKWRTISANAVVKSTSSALKSSGQFACRECGARFHRKSNCTRHMRMHDYTRRMKALKDCETGRNERNSHCCSLCTESDTAHLSQSHGLAGRLHLCSTCRQVFTSLAELRQHQEASLHQPWRSCDRQQCPAKDCRRCFTLPKHLAEHRLLHPTPPQLRPHRCPVCLAAGCNEDDVTFCWQFQLVEHCVSVGHLSRVAEIHPA